MLLRSIISILYSKQQFLFVFVYIAMIQMAAPNPRPTSVTVNVAASLTRCQSLSYYGFDHYQGPRKEVRSLNCCRFNLKVTESRKEVRSLNLGEHTLIHCNALFSDCFLPWLIYTILRQTHESKFAIYQFFMPMKILLR